MIKHRSNARELMNSKIWMALETLKKMSSNRKISIWALVAMICLSLTGCGGATTSSTTPSQPGHTSTGHPTGMWSTLPYTMPINPVHAALLHTGKVLIVSGSGNCPPTQNFSPSWSLWIMSSRSHKPRSSRSSRATELEPSWQGSLMASKSAIPCGNSYRGGAKNLGFGH